VDWNRVDKEAYLAAMVRNVVNDMEIKALLKAALTVLALALLQSIPLPDNQSPQPQ